MNDFFSRFFTRDILREEHTNIFNHKGMKDYLDACLVDYQNLVNHIYNRTRYHEPQFYPHEPFRFNYIWDTKFVTSIRWSDDGCVQFDFPIGTLLTLDDLYSRLAANGDFFTFDPYDEGKNLMGEKYSIWYIPFGGALPKERYFNYTPQRLHPKEKIAKPEGTYLSNYYEAFPVDAERRNLYKYMVLIALTFIFLHEEWHYTGGHLYTIKNSPIKSFSMTENKKYIFSDMMQFKAMEWEADRSAICGIIDAFIVHENDYFEYIPSYVKNKEIWNARLVFSVVGALIQVIQKNRILNSTIDNYPSPRTRLFSCAYHFEKRYFSHKGLSEKTAQDLVFIFQSSFDDIYIVSDLMNRQSSQVSSWNFFKPPVPRRLRNQSLFDSPYEARIAFKLFLAAHKGRQGNDAFILNEKEESLFRKWFDESTEIGRYHQEYFWPKFSKFRAMTGLPND